MLPARIICMYGIVCGFNECVLSVVDMIPALMPQRLPLVLVECSQTS
eukprot:COSAG01_NODE_25_length_37050_cov_211.559119_7_plen_47_part_00